eukprot:1370705-Alexandrium_andersonii.AAC.1
MCIRDRGTLAHHRRSLALHAPSLSHQHPSEMAADTFTLSQRGDGGGYWSTAGERRVNLHDTERQPSTRITSLIMQGTEEMR